MKHLFILTTCLALAISALNAQTPSSTAIDSPTPSAAAAVGASPGSGVSPEATVAPTPGIRVAHKGLDTNQTAKDAHACRLVSILVPLGFFAMVATVVWLVFSARERQRRLTHETIRLMIEKGQPVPPELFLDPKIAKPRNDLRRGVLLIAAGFGIVVFFLAHHDRAWSLGVIPLLVGVGYIIVWKIQGGQKNNGTPS